ncbi:hypothetical protein [Enterococcus pallens]|uniref:Uncharacterized protein n=1 Tax=Enterococcus pallens ATCC BAA-351 TaxID=1158607 RepID=R2SY54_9ENTE|nr:hypothetical protein [Enterococcus pallens]EOH97711.1 hypothetical protein UAU_00379 [Enterococcus pallens ATCC BAA-351]EOU20870.1 hypothetical protein I588_01717 [Enterococcus pallens ATCC BAA-351]OJG70941.1 hypothetical protein RV10_GL005093 [Enterococcus pallens]
MKQSQNQLTLYPTPAPSMQEELVTRSLLEEIERACEYLYASHGTLNDEQREKIYQHFEQLFRLMNSSYHIELLLIPGTLNWKAFWQALHQFFPQFAWLNAQTEEPKYGRQVYRFDFVPLVYREAGFPFAIHLEDSLNQQFPTTNENALERAEQLLLELAEQHFSEGIVQEPQPEEANPIKPIIKQTQESTMPMDPIQKEEVRQESQSKARLRAVNQKLELVIEKLELSMLYSGIQYFDQKSSEESDWDKRIKISLREYTYLLQKARFLEQMWHLNGELINKSEKMTVTGNKLVYERDQVKQIKANLSARDIHFVLYECQVIESRAKVHARPWFRKPYVKLMKMDYDNLLSKAAYFDLLQGESALLERMVREQRDTPVKEAQEAG